jgi:hypothetical protein
MALRLERQQLVVEIARALAGELRVAGIDAVAVRTVTGGADALGQPFTRCLLAVRQQLRRPRGRRRQQRGGEENKYSLL